MAGAYQDLHNGRMSRLNAVVRNIGHHGWFAAVGRRLVPLDRWLMARRRGRWSVGRFVGVPTLLLTTTGRRSGRARTQPLAYIVDGEAYVVVGSNWGQRHQPAWSANLRAHPDATVSVEGATVPVRAVQATGPDRERLWQRMRAVWPAYQTYQDRASGREIRIFRLQPRTDSAS
jgi:deazaflavin-dependent oxidoreductase (nitroreductase family)